MSTSLKDVLNEKAARYAAESEKNREAIEEWRRAVEALFNQLMDWLAVIDPDSHVQHELTQIKVTEPGLGQYEIARLDLRALGKWVGVIPKARKTVKSASLQQADSPERASGRVDITDEIRRFILYRFGEGTEEQWFVDDTATKDDLYPLTREQFESALVAYFQ